MELEIRTLGLDLKYNCTLVRNGVLLPVLLSLWSRYLSAVLACLGVFTTRLALKRSKERLEQPKTDAARLGSCSHHGVVFERP